MINEIYLSLWEIEQYYKVSRHTLRAYINRNQVIPTDAYVKVQGIWKIKKSWVDANYQAREMGAK